MKIYFPDDPVKMEMLEMLTKARAFLVLCLDVKDGSVGDNLIRDLTELIEKSTGDDITRVVS